MAAEEDGAEHQVGLSSECFSVPRRQSPVKVQFSLDTLARDEAEILAVNHNSEEFKCKRPSPDLPAVMGILLFTPSTRGQ